MILLLRRIVMFGFVKFGVRLVIVSGLMTRLRRDLIIVFIRPQNMLKPAQGFQTI